MALTLDKGKQSDGQQSSFSDLSWDSWERGGSQDSDKVFDIRLTERS